VRLRYAGSIRQGLREWLLQRITAVYMGGFALWAVVYLALDGPESFVDWRARVLAPGFRVALALFLGSSMVHAWIGLRSVYLDYLKPLWVRTAVSGLTFIALWALGLWTAVILLLGEGA
jgi:succinate dehydrogenase / fumarate reductase membrane anchor subunit